MRFSDTLDGWNNELQTLRQSSNAMAFLNAISKETLSIISNHNSNTCNFAESNQCHKNVHQHIQNAGGKQVFGWYIQIAKMLPTAEFDGVLTACFHSNWLSPQGHLVNITPLEHQFHIFLPDAKRSVDVSRGIFYNNRMVFLDTYKCPSFAKEPPRNVNLYTANGHISRDRMFERYEFFENIDEAVAKVPEHMKCMKKGQLALSPEGQKFLALTSNVHIR